MYKFDSSELVNYVYFQTQRIVRPNSRWASYSKLNGHVPQKNPEPKPRARKVEHACVVPLWGLVWS